MSISSNSIIRFKGPIPVQWQAAFLGFLAATGSGFSTEWDGGVDLEIEDLGKDQVFELMSRDVVCDDEHKFLRLCESAGVSGIIQVELTSNHEDSVAARISYYDAKRNVKEHDLAAGNNSPLNVYIPYEELLESSLGYILKRYQLPEELKYE